MAMTENYEETIDRLENAIRKCGTRSKDRLGLELALVEAKEKAFSEHQADPDYAIGDFFESLAVFV